MYVFFLLLFLHLHSHTITLHVHTTQKIVVSCLNHTLHIAIFFLFNFLSSDQNLPHHSGFDLTALELLMSWVFGSQASAILVLELKHVFSGGKMLKYQDWAQASCQWKRANSYGC